MYKAKQAKACKSSSFLLKGELHHLLAVWGIISQITALQHIPTSAPVYPQVIGLGFRPVMSWTNRAQSRTQIYAQGGSFQSNRLKWVHHLLDTSLRDKASTKNISWIKNTSSAPPSHTGPTQNNLSFGLLYLHLLSVSFDDDTASSSRVLNTKLWCYAAKLQKAKCVVF